METVAIMLGVIVLGVIGIAWDYYKPSRFRTGYHNVRKNGDSISGDSSNDSSCGDAGD